MRRALPILLALALLGGCGRSGELFQGYVEGEYVYVASPLGGQLEALDVSRGQSVERGARLFVLDAALERAAEDEVEHVLAQSENRLADLRKGKRPSEVASIQAQLDEARAARGLADSEYRRRIKLFDQKTIAREDLDRARTESERARQRMESLAQQLATARLGAREDEIRAAEAEVRAARSRLDQARWNLEQKTQAAPASGLVFDTLYRAGEWVPAGRPVVALLPPENVRVRFFVPETRVGSLAPGQEVEVLVDGRAEPARAEITFVSPEAEYAPPVIYSSESRAKLVFRVEARPRPGQSPLNPGQPVDVRSAGGS
ncbi:HlyD family efflux transporter periplasmic adaptor subunit [Desulfovibrio aminophilus]|uniref:HlyD family secretion protein n=1 Tax=Desulfovibrio aminophilus TaxID=81425 RepID=UPI003395DB66